MNRRKLILFGMVAGSFLGTMIVKSLGFNPISMMSLMGSGIGAIVGILVVNRMS